MDRPAALSSSDLETIALQLGDLISKLYPDEVTTTSRAEIAESFAMWTAASEPVGDGASLKAVAEFTGRWHHRIRVDGIPLLYARSSAAGGDWSIDEIGPAVVSDQDLKSVLELEPSDSADILMLWLPEQHVTALWSLAEEASMILVVEAPAEFDLDPGRAYAEDRFLQHLRDHIRTYVELSQSHWFEPPDAAPPG